MSTNIQQLLSTTRRSFQLHDEKGRPMQFPDRRDYIGQLKSHGLIADEEAFVAADALNEAVYLDWLRRPQVGCVFAQLLARPRNRAGMRTLVARGSSGAGDPAELAAQISQIVSECVRDDTIESLSVLMPQILEEYPLTQLVWELGALPGWDIEIEQQWRQYLVLIGLRVEVADGVAAEILGMGPFRIFPPTRQCPITTLEIRTKTKRAKRSHTSMERNAAHLADIPTDDFLSRSKHRKLFTIFTPGLKKRILGGKDDDRARARVTYSLPAAMWHSLKSAGSERSLVKG